MFEEMNLFSVSVSSFACTPLKVLLDLMKLKRESFHMEPGSRGETPVSPLDDEAHLYGLLLHVISYEETPMIPHLHLK
jgi:hypothetical protein